MLNSGGHSFDQLCLPHRTDLFNFARRLTGNASRADDIVQDSFVKALLAWSRWTPESGDPVHAARAWLYRIVTNRFVNDTRNVKARNQLALDRSPEIVSSLYGNTESIGCVLQASGMRSAPQDVDVRIRLVCHYSTFKHSLPTDTMSFEVRTALDRLHPKRRAIIEAFYFQGDTCEVIADKLHMPSSSVRTWLVRTRVKLWPLLQHYAQVMYGLRCAGVRPHAQPAKVVQPEADSVKRVVGKRHARALRYRQKLPDQLATG